MKTHTIKTDNAELLLVELPQGWIFNIYKDQIGFCNEINKPMTKIKGSYTLLGKPDEIKEEDARELVQYLTRRDLTITPKNYLEGKDGRFEDITFAESLLSLLETEIFWKNPYDKSGMTFANEYENKWQEAEQKTFGRNRTLIFKKNK